MNNTTATCGHCKSHTEWPGVVEQRALLEWFSTHPCTGSNAPPLGGEFVDRDTDLVIPRCPKCNGLMDEVVWHGGVDGRCGWRAGPHGAQRCPGINADGKVVRSLTEHMHRDCSTCGYQTWEHPLDSTLLPADAFDGHDCGPECMYFHTDVPHMVLPRHREVALDALRRAAKELRRQATERFDSHGANDPRAAALRDAGCHIDPDDHAAIAVPPDVSVE